MLYCCVIVRTVIYTTHYVGYKQHAKMLRHGLVGASVGSENNINRIFILV